MLAEILEKIEVNEAIKKEHKVRKDKDTGVLVATWIFDAYGVDVIDALRDHIDNKSTLIWQWNGNGYTTKKVTVKDYEDTISAVRANDEIYKWWSSEFTDLQRDIILSLQLKA